MPSAEPTILPTYGSTLATGLPSRAPTMAPTQGAYRGLFQRENFPRLVAVVDVLFVYRIDIDAFFVSLENDTITFDVRRANPYVTFPAWLSLYGHNRTLMGVPNASYIGNNDVLVVAFDEGGNWRSALLPIEVKA